MDTAATLSSAAAALVNTTQGIRADQFGQTTPCGDWTVQELMNHLTGSLEYFAAAAEGKKVDIKPAPAAGFDETVQRLQQSAQAMAGAWSKPAPPEPEGASGGGMPRSALAAIAASETLTHAWDLARATGQQSPARDLKLGDLLGTMQQTLKPEARQPAFGPEQKAPEGCPDIDRLAAFLGRTV
ncbi:MAG: TIGR03086 family protein [Chloroflexi bacterium]|nr:TIGR03086 family protein [Chloroflexota bacterium]